MSNLIKNSDRGLYNQVNYSPERTHAHTHTDKRSSSSPANSHFTESSPDSGSVLLGFRKLHLLCLFIHMLIGFYGKQWTDQSHDGICYNPSTTYPGHTLFLRRLFFRSFLHRYLCFKGFFSFFSLRRVADSTVLWCLVVMEMQPLAVMQVD